MAREIQRKSLQARITHDVTIICCIWLIISGLFVFVPPLAAAVGPDVMFVIRMSHRVIGVAYIVVPVISAIIAPKGVRHIVKNLFTKWDKDDVNWIKKFVPYLLFCRKVHMPDQREVKSGQRLADGMLWLCCLMMAISGVGLLLGDTVLPQPNWLMLTWRIAHDVFFILLDILAIAHIYMGSGIFQPYKDCARIMFGDGKVTEATALYHWGHWAREELEKGDKVVEEPEPAAKGA